MRHGTSLWPKGLKVGGSLHLGNTKIAALPEGLSVGGYVDLRDTNITALPEGLKVGGDLDLRGSKITSLPEGVGGEILGGPAPRSVPEPRSGGVFAAVARALRPAAWF